MNERVAPYNCEYCRVTVKGTKGLPAVARFLVEMEEIIAWTNNMELTRVSFVKKEKGWALSLGAKKDGTNYVCFAHSAHLIGCLRNLYKIVTSSGTVWMKDRYNP